MIIAVQLLSIIGEWMYPDCKVLPSDFDRHLRSDTWHLFHVTSRSIHKSVLGISLQQGGHKPQQHTPLHRPQRLRALPTARHTGRTKRQSPLLNCSIAPRLGCFTQWPMADRAPSWASPQAAAVCRPAAALQDVRPRTASRAHTAPPAPR